MSRPGGQPARRLRVAGRAAVDAALPLPAAPRGATLPRIAALGAAAAALLGYALVRYAVVKGEPLASVPLWMTNKAVAVLAVGLLAAAALRPAAPWRSWARACALGAAALHGAASLALLRPAYYPKLFEGGPAGRMTGAGELAVLCGTLALVVFLALRLPREPVASARPFAHAAGLAGAVLAVAHCAALGLRSWLAPERWPGALPPMSLLGALLAAVAVAGALARRDPRPAPGAVAVPAPPVPPGASR